MELGLGNPSYAVVKYLTRGSGFPDTRLACMARMVDMVCIIDCRMVRILAVVGIEGVAGLLMMAAAS